LGDTKTIRSFALKGHRSITHLAFASWAIIARSLVGQSKQLNQTIQIEHGNIVKNPNWLEANQVVTVFTNTVEDLNMGLP